MFKVGSIILGYALSVYSAYGSIGAYDYSMINGFSDNINTFGPRDYKYVDILNSSSSDNSVKSICGWIPVNSYDVNTKIFNSITSIAELRLLPYHLAYLRHCILGLKRNGIENPVIDVTTLKFLISLFYKYLQMNAGSKGVKPLEIKNVIHDLTVNSFVFRPVQECITAINSNKFNRVIFSKWLNGLKTHLTNRFVSRRRKSDSTSSPLTEIYAQYLLDVVNALLNYYESKAVPNEYKRLYFATIPKSQLQDEKGVGFFINISDAVSQSP